MNSLAHPHPKSKVKDGVSLSFGKMHGLGNDFILLDARTDPRLAKLAPQQIRWLCDRRRGIGCDQLLLLVQPQNPNAQIRMLIYNPDGSESGACGNATRCVAALLYTALGKGPITIETLAGLLPCQPIKGNLFRVDMGRPETDAKAIPLKQGYKVEAIDPLEAMKNEAAKGLSPNKARTAMQALGKLKPGYAVGMGNPHCVFFHENIKALDLTLLGPLLEHHPAFPEKTNVEFVQILSADHLEQRTWERAAGETLACGSGACAVTFAGLKQGLTSMSVRIDLKGGRLDMSFNQQNQHISMQGPASFVFEGQIVMPYNPYSFELGESQ